MATAVCLFAGCTATIDEPAKSKSASIEVKLSTADPHIGVNAETERRECVWVETSYVLKNSDGKIVATEDLPKGAATVGDHEGAVGQLISSKPPDYECILKFTIRPEESDFYELEVTTLAPHKQKTYTQVKTFSVEDSPVTITFD